MRHEFEYQRVGNKFYPIIPILVGLGERLVPASALVDSGATVSIFNADVGRALGVRIETGELIKPAGISGTITAYVHKVKVKINDEEVAGKVAFTDELAVPINLLGRENIFEAFSVLFNDKIKKVVLERI